MVFLIPRFLCCFNLFLPVLVLNYFIPNFIGWLDFVFFLI